MQIEDRSVINHLSYLAFEGCNMHIVDFEFNFSLARSKIIFYFMIKLQYKAKIIWLILEKYTKKKTSKMMIIAFHKISMSEVAN